MPTNDFIFDLLPQKRPIIKVIGVGGGGSNAVNYMYNQGIKDVEFVVCNTDEQALRSSPVPLKLQLGATLTEGLGAGANPEKGRDAALESKDDIRDLLAQGTKMVFITAGMGGGTGTGAAPVIAQIAQSLGILTVAIVTAPFNGEGTRKKDQAYQGIEQLKQHCDTVLVILNDKLIDLFGDLPKGKAFAQADGVLTNAAKSIAEIITKPGYINTDFEDVKKVMKSAGQAVMGSAQAKGESRAKKVIEEALSSPLLNSRDIRGAKKILLTMFYSTEKEMTLGEQSTITNYILEKTGREPEEVIMGDVLDESLGEDLRITIIATGFDETEISETDKKRYLALEPDKSVSNTQTKEPVTNVQKEDIPPVIEKNYIYLEEIDEVVSEESGNVVDDKELKRKQLEQRAILLLQKNHSQEEMKDYEDKPAFERKKVKFQERPHSSENNVSRFTLNEEDGISGNNKFLHDNVD
jgi:cell division protein FtsZ